MYVDSLLDSGGRRLGQGLAVTAAALIGILLVAICMPLLVLAIVLSAVGTGPRAPLTSLAADATPVSGPAAGSRPSPTDLHDPSPAGGALVIDMARRYLGVRYVFGGTDPNIGLDCSGLVQLVFRQLGIPLPRTAQQQYNATERLTPDQLQPGDLVFFARTYADPNDWVTHVGIYLGNGQQINAPTAGQVVSIQPVFTWFWGAHFAGGGRVASR